MPNNPAIEVEVSEKMKRDLRILSYLNDTDTFA